MIAVCEDRVRLHLGVPPGVVPCRQWPALIDGARDWCRERVTAWVRTRHVTIACIDDDVLSTEPGPQLHSRRLAQRLRSARAHGIVVAAISAGREIDHEIKRLWSAGRPDEAMTLNAYGSALVEELRARVAGRLSRALGSLGVRVLPYLSPGYEGWPLEDQANLFSLIEDVAGPIELLESGGLRPSKSTLAAFGLARSGSAGAAWDPSFSTP